MEFVSSSDSPCARDGASPELTNSAFMSTLWLRFVKSAPASTISKEEVLNVIHRILIEGHKGMADSSMLGSQVLRSLLDSQCLVPHWDRGYQMKEPLFSVQGVLMPLTGCYSPRCSPQYLCYAPSCPNKGDILHLSSPQAYNNTSTSSEALRDEHHLALPSQERKRQNAIEEILESERQYCCDLETIRDIYAGPLLESPAVIEETRRLKFHDIVFGNYLVIHKLHRQNYEDLLAKKDSVNGLFLGSIGTVIWDHVSRWMDAYVAYAANHVKAAYVATVETNRSTRFDEFLDTQNTHTNTRRLGLRHYLTLPTLRLGKYKLLLEALHRYTSDEGDQLALGAALAELGDILERMNESTRQAEVETQRLRIASTLLIPDHISTTVQQIIPENATLLHEGSMMLARSLHSWTMVPCRVFLFTHLVVVTRPRLWGKHEEFVVAGDPIPLHMLRLNVPRIYGGGAITAAPVISASSASRDQTITGLYIRARFRRLRNSLRHSKTTPEYKQQQSQQQQPRIIARRTTPAAGPSRAGPRVRMLTLSHLGLSDCTFYLACSTMEERDEWRNLICSAMQSVQINQGPVSLSPLCEVATGSGRQSSIVVGGSAMFPTGCGRIWCTLPFDLPDGRSMLALGTQYGIWIGPRDGESHEFRLAVAQEDCRQLAIMDNIALLVRTRRSALMAYDLQQICIPSSYHRWGYIHRSSVVSFAVGNIYNVRVLCYLLQRRSCTVLVITHYKGEWFRKAKEYRLESRDVQHVQLAHDVVFLQSPTLGIGRVLNGRCEWKDTFPGTIGFVPFSYESGYAYGPRAAWHIRFGNTNKGSFQDKVEFDARLQKLAVIPPYLMGFSPSIIEIRHMITGKTIQVLAGSHIRCVHASYDNEARQPVIHVSILHHADHVIRIYLATQKAQ